MQKAFDFDGQDSRGGKLITSPSGLTIAYGFDTVCLSYWVSWSDVAWHADLERLKAESAATNVDACFEVPHVGAFNVAPTGHRTGGPFAAYLLESRGVRISFTTGDGLGDTPNLFVNVGSLACLQIGVRGAMRLVESLVDFLGGQPRKHVVSRADLCCDLLEVHVSELQNALRDDRVVCRARDIREDEEMHIATFRSGRTLTGFTIGGKTASLKLRVYDKAREVKRDEVKEAAFRAAWWGDAKEVTRIEFQLRRERLSSISFDTVDDLEKNARTLWRYLTGEWVRFVRDSVDRHHTDRAVVSDVWASVQMAWSDVPTSIARLVSRVRPKLHLSALKAQVVGCLTTMLALWQVDGEGFFDGFQRCLSSVVDVVCETDRPQWKYKQKLRALAGALP